MAKAFRKIETGIRESYFYDPLVKGIDTEFWNANVDSEVNSVTANSGNLRFNTTHGTTYSQHLYGEFTFDLNVPTTPSAGEAKIWGLRNPAEPTHGAAYFEITGATFQVVTYSDDENAQTTTVTWSSYEAVMTEFKIVWDRRYVQFDIAGSNVATHRTRVPTVPLAVDIENDDADNTDLNWLLARNVGVII